MDGWMDKEDIVYIYNGILFSLKKGAPVICNNMDEVGRNYPYWNKPQKEKTALSPLFVEYKKSQLHKSR